MTLMHADQPPIDDDGDFGDKPVSAAACGHYAGSMAKGLRIALHPRLPA